PALAPHDTGIHPVAATAPPTGPARPPARTGTAAATPLTCTDARWRHPAQHRPDRGLARRAAARARQPRRAPAGGCGPGIAAQAGRTLPGRGRRWRAAAV